ncbi:MAG: flavodoxin-dependent (E)-4-hydroxy-3-methylbut-2-enyl-diphosphate synthase [Clostridia bacterium]|nr:flavodoxin-dependent (E)-4-hydroxy-3-methylbut-2-enyl-diphosphate synthase [Clostridia bacterium]
MYTNNETKKIKVGNIFIGGGAPVTIQSMLNVRAEDILGNVKQAIELEKAGCEIIRVSVPNKEAIELIYKIKENINVPLVADIHFDYKLALESVAAGVDKIRINPGNIGSNENVKKVALACKTAGVPIRIGVNSGSLEKEILARYGSPTPEAMVESGLYHISLLNKFDFDDIVLSLKSSDTRRTYDAYVLAAERCNYPLHIGVTEAGTQKIGTIKSSAALGGLLLRNIGNTVRISLTDNPVKEVEAATDLLRAIGIKKGGIKFVSCPTCGRTKIDLIGLAKAAEERLKGVNKDLTVAIMGCVVNGPGEAKEADIGIAGGDGCAVLFKKDGITRKIPEQNILDELVLEIEKM